MITSVQFSCSVVSDSLRPHEPQHARHPCPSVTPSPPKPMSIESVMPSNHLILCCPLLLLPSIFPSIRVFSNESALYIRLPRSKCLLISWLQPPSAVILEPRKIKSATVFTVSPSICHELMGLDNMMLVF